MITGNGYRRDPKTSRDQREWSRTLHSGRRITVSVQGRKKRERESSPYIVEYSKAINLKMINWICDWLLIKVRVREFLPGMSPVATAVVKVVGVFVSAWAVADSRWPTSPWWKRRKSTRSAVRGVGMTSFPRSRGDVWRRRRDKRSWRKSICCHGWGTVPNRYCKGTVAFSPGEMGSPGFLMGLNTVWTDQL